MRTLFRVCVPNKDAFGRWSYRLFENVATISLTQFHFDCSLVGVGGAEGWVEGDYKPLEGIIMRAGEQVRT
jgi:hypothetical protein